MTDINSADYVRYQYSDSEKFLVRVETHRLYSEAPGSLVEWVMDIVRPERGARLLDVGCGPGVYHGEAALRGASIVALDLFPAMLRDVLGRAGDGGWTAWAARASAECLPLPDASFDRVMANHMLYHVQDQSGALREMRRVLRPGGRVVLATNAADNMRRFHDVHAEACVLAGLTPQLNSSVHRFTLDHLPLVREVFPSASVRLREDAVVFTDTDSALRFYASFLVDYVDPLPPDGNHRPPLLNKMRELIGDIIVREGAFRVEKAAGCFVADV